MTNKKLIIIAIVILLAVLPLSACGGRYTCIECGKTTGKAYYDFSGTKDNVMCEDCARSYWMPLDYTEYKVK